MTISNIASINSLFANIYEDALFVAREVNLMAGLVTPYSARGYMTRTVSAYPQITAAAKAEGEDFVGATEWTKTSLATFTPATIFAQTILTDERLATDPDDARMDASRELGEAIATKIDVDLATDMASFTTDKGAGAAASATLAKFAAAIAVLRAANVPNPINIVLHPYHWFDVWTELGQPAATKVLLGDIANKALRDFFVGDWLGANWFSSSNIATDSEDDAVSGVFNPQAMALDTRQRPEMEPERDASRKAWELNISAGYAHGIRRDAFGVKYTADATEPS